MKLYHRIVATVVGVLFLAAVARNLAELGGSVPTMAELANLPVIVIDPGHGGMDGGAVSNDCVEKDMNLAIALALRDMLEVSGFRVVMTRESDVSIHDEGITSTRKQKTSDLHNRLAIAENEPNAIFLSIHQNKFTDSGSKGAQIFHSPNNPESERLAAILQESFVANLQPDNRREIKKAGDNLFLMTNLGCPAVLIECGFLSNAEEAKRLADPAYQKQIAFTILGAVVRFLGLDEPIAAPPLPTEEARENTLQSEK